VTCMRDLSGPSLISVKNRSPLSFGLFVERPRGKLPPTAQLYYGALYFDQGVAGQNSQVGGFSGQGLGQIQHCGFCVMSWSKTRDGP
jgi:hypothetical protein